MSAAEKVECDRCGLKVRVLADGTVADHSWTRHGVKHHCDYSGQRYPRHTGGFRVTERGPDGIATEWVCECRCGKVWVGPDHESVEGKWRTHLQDSKAAA